MADKLGDKIMLAAADQGWTVVDHGTMVRFVSSQVAASFDVPHELLDDPAMEPTLRGTVLLDMIVAGHLQWPWPPDHVEWIHGETPLME
jgi:hypothetical protein